MQAALSKLDFAPRVSSPALFLGSYPPRECGIATFTHDVVESFDRQYGVRSDIIAVDEPGSDDRRYPTSVVGRLQRNAASSYVAIAELINRHSADLLNIQHEYGLFGGENGSMLLELVALVRKPVVVTLHTVLPEPDPHHLATARALCTAADMVVVLSETGKDILHRTYDIPLHHITVVPHGVPSVPFRSTNDLKKGFGLEGRTVISTFGLISRGKGLEYAIEAMSEVTKRHPEALYLILGGTHPEVRRHEGESYRETLTSMVKEAGLTNNVRLVDRYLAFDELIRYLGATDIYLTPYLNPVQIVSGTLAYAVGCGKAIVSTPYLYAKELLAHGRGFLAEFRDAASIATTISALLDDPELRHATERRAYRFGRQMTWPNVSQAYGKVFSDLLPAQPTSLALGMPA